MPELPEVETVVRELNQAAIAGATIRRVDLLWPATAAAAPGAKPVASLCGETVKNVGRRAKYIVIEFVSGSSLLIHLRMTGKLRFVQADTELLPHDRLVLWLSDKRGLVLNDTRKFARVRFVPDATTALATLGPEPLERSFTVAALTKALQKYKRAIKTVLLDQTVVAGIGNIYADEALFDAGLHPERPAATLTPVEIGRLHKSIRKVLRLGIRANGTTLGNSQANFYSVAGRRGGNELNLKVFRRDGLACLTCGHEISRSVVGGRGTHFCPCCQSR